MTAENNTVPGGVATPPARPVGAVVLGALYVDMDNVRARYECARPGCTQRHEGPVRGADDVKAFVDGIKTDHLSRCTGEPR